MKKELILWVMALLGYIPGRIGCLIRSIILPYKRGREVYIWDKVYIDSPSKLIIGNNVSINRGGIINAGGGIHIGDDVLIGPSVTIYSQNHRYNIKEEIIRLQGYIHKKVIIKNNVWIGANSIVLPGVTIGADIVIGAGSLVNKSIFKPGVYAGNPVKYIKELN